MALNDGQPRDTEAALPDTEPFVPAADFGICARCHHRLTRPSTSGGCLRCMMDAVASEDEDAFDPVAAGEELRRYSHFEILQAKDGSLDELGHGAMGTTYRAVDTVLRSTVALKVIRRTIADSPSIRGRFLREARAAAKLRHPNVASVFHYGEQEGECFYVMELVEGETLDERVRRDGPLPTVWTLEIAVQVARALAAAEACGVVHRDLKPSNIMLTARHDDGDDGEKTVVKVIDWGLAKSVTLESVLGFEETRQGFVGTPAFASPEQYVREEDERVDTRSDIYSLGVTVWYLLCGKMPFVGRMLGEIYEQQTTQPLPMDQLRSANVPAPLVALLRAMLAPAPVARPQSARELLKLFTDCQARLCRPGRRKLQNLATAGSILCLAIILGLSLWHRETPHPTAFPDISVAVLPFENRGGEASEAFFSEGIHDAIAADLARIAQLRMIGSDSVKAYGADKPRDLPAIARVLGSAQVLEGSVQREGGHLRIELRLVVPGSPARDWAVKYDRPLAEEFALLSEMTRAVAERLGCPPSPAETALINRRPTHDPVAYDLYLRAREHPNFHQDEDQLRRTEAREIALLNEAVARDPGFVLAYCRLAEAHDLIASNLEGASAEERAVDHRALAEAALAKARELQPDGGEVHLAYANHEALVTRDLARAQVDVDLARRTLPNDIGVERVAGQIAKMQGRWEDALRAQEKAVALDPRNLGLHARLEQIEVNLRHYAAADRELATMESLLPPNAVASLPVSRALLVLQERADLAPLRAALAEMTDAQDPDHELRDAYGLILALFEHDESQVRYVLAASKRSHFNIADFDYPRAWFEALAARLRGDDPAARAAFATARTDVAKSVQADVRNERSLLLLAMIDAALGSTDDAVREAQRACAMTPLQSGRLTGPADRCCLAVVYAWTNQNEAACAELDKLVSGPAGDNIPSQPTYGDLRLNPLWDSLRGDPRFAALTEKLSPKMPR